MSTIGDTAKGAAAGSAILPGIGTAVGAAAGLASSLFKASAAKKQLALAEKLNPSNPGYQINYGVLDNAKTVADMYGNYTLPGQTAAENQIDANYSTGFAGGAAGASSGGDLIDLAAKLTYGKNQANTALNVAGAQGKQDMLGQFLSTQAAAGRESQDKNAYDRDQYDKIVQTKAALNQAGNQNLYGVLDQAGAALGSYLNPKKIAGDAVSKPVTPGASIFSGVNGPLGSMDVASLKRMINKPI